MCGQLKELCLKYDSCRVVINLKDFNGLKQQRVVATQDRRLFDDSNDLVRHEGELFYELAVVYEISFLKIQSTTILKQYRSSRKLSVWNLLFKLKVLI